VITLEMHTHLARRLTAWALGLLMLAPLPLSLGRPAPRSKLSPVEGQVTLGGRPVRDLMICFDSGGAHCAYGAILRDGSFRVETDGHGAGALPGTYRVHFYPLYTGADIPSLPARYRSAGTSDLELTIGPDWHRFQLDLE
jgi:hypothetical protein